jgi:ribonuclease P protein component
MKGEQHLNKPEQYDSIYKRGSSAADRFLAFKAVRSELDFSRFGISVSRKIGNAVVRNKVKRRLREILRSAPLPGGWDFIVIARRPSAESDYNQLKGSALALLSRLKIMR